MQLMRGKREKEKKEEKERKRSDLLGFTLDPLQHRVEGRLAKPAIQPGLFVVCESLAESLGAVVEGVTKRLVDTLDVFPTSHKDLICQ